MIEAKKIIPQTDKKAPDPLFTFIHLNEIQIDEEIEKLLGTLHFSDEELAEIEVRAKEGLKITAKKRNTALDDLHARQRRAYADLDYLKQNKITLLRNGTPIQKYNSDIAKLEKELEVVVTDMNVYKEVEHEMLKYVLTFSELVKNAQLYYKHALDTEKRDIASQVFSELIFADRKLFHYTAKEGYDALLKCRFVLSGSADYLFTELIGAYQSVIVGTRAMEKMAFLQNCVIARSKLFLFLEKGA